MTQRDLFGAPAPLPFRPRDAFATAPTERRRWSAQCEAIYRRLQQGPATNQELAALSLKYTSRISDLRQAGVAVRCISLDRATGRAVYALDVSDATLDSRDRTDVG